jgi:NAD(P)-dependent dehydrogenase (short-subunit alcohol dehydrogenase family)
MASVNDRKLSRRHFITGASSVAIASTLPGCGSPDQQGGATPEGVPIGPFGPDSTSMDVVAGIDLSGQTALITGCNSGLGYETARVLSAQGATIIGAARTLEKAETACNSFSGPAIPVVCELGDLESVAAAGEAVKSVGAPIDMLILNAGIMALPELEQINGIEKQFFVNHLGHFTLTSHLLDQVVAAPQGRVVVLSSSGYSFAPEAGIDFDNLSGERDYDGWKMYGTSKLANGLFSLELANRLADTNATSNSLHPGIINTNLGRHFPLWQRIASNLIGWTFMKSVEEGAATQCYVATAPDLAGNSGYYFSDCNPLTPDSRMLDKQQATTLWEVSEGLAAGYLNG